MNNVNVLAYSRINMIIFSWKVGGALYAFKYFNRQYLSCGFAVMMSYVYLSVFLLELLL